MRALILSCFLIVPTLLPAAAQENAAESDLPAIMMPSDAALPAGTYALDPAHASLIFRVNHLGFSNFTARFTRFDAELAFDLDDPGAMRVSATIDPASIETDYPDPETYDFNADLAGELWLDAAQYPQIAFQSTHIELTGEHTALVTGDLDLHGVTHPLTLTVTFNGGYESHPLDPGGSRIGFSAHGSLLRSDHGIALGIPPEGTEMGVGDLVEVIIEAEFLRPLTD